MTFDAALHPDGPSGVPGLLAAADAVRDRVLGFIVQCDVCPQKAIVATQPERGWVCPRCTDAHGGFGDVDVAQAEPAACTDCTCVGFHTSDCRVAGVETGHDMGLSHAAEMFPQHQSVRSANIAAAAHINESLRRSCIHQAVRYGVCADCGQIPQYPWGAAIPVSDDDYPIGKVRG